MKLDMLFNKVHKLKGEIIMNQLKTFNHPMFGELPVVLVKGKEYFGATDVAKSLEYKQPEHAVKNHCDSEGCISYTVPTDGGKQQKNFITLGNVSRLIVAASKQSKNQEIKQKAKVYEKWIFDEIIPSVHKHGAYMTPSVLEQAINNPDFMIGLFQQLKVEKEEKQRLHTKNLILEQHVNEMKPKVSYYDLILQNKSLLTVNKIAKDYGMSATTFNRKLHELGIQYRQGETWLVYAKYQNKGYTHTEPFVVNQYKSKIITKWTQKGRRFLYDILKENGILPMIERDSKVV